MTYRLSCRVAGRLLVATLLAGLATPSHAVDPAYPSGASVGLVPPPGMTPSSGFAGFEHGSGASIIIMEMPVEAYGPVVEKFTPEALRATGFVVAGSGEALPLAGGEGRILRGSQSANGLTYAKWVAVVRSGSGTGLVTVQVPEGARAEVPDAAVEASLRTIAFRATPSVAEQISALPYAVGDMAGFRPVRVLAGSALVLTDGPKDVDPDGSQPVVVVASSMGETRVGSGQEAAFARRALATLPQVRDLAVTDEDRSTRGSAVVVRLRGSATHAKSGRAVGVTQTMLFDGARFLRVLGTAPADRAEALARADRVAASAVLREGGR